MIDNPDWCKTCLKVQNFWSCSMYMWLMKTEKLTWFVWENTQVRINVIFVWSFRDVQEISWKDFPRHRLAHWLLRITFLLLVASKESLLVRYVHRIWALSCYHIRPQDLCFITLSHTYFFRLLILHKIALCICQKLPVLYVFYSLSDYGVCGQLAYILHIYEYDFGENICYCKKWEQS